MELELRLTDVDECVEIERHQPTKSKNLYETLNMMWRYATIWLKKSLSVSNTNVNFVFKNNWLIINWINGFEAI